MSDKLRPDPYFRQCRCRYCGRTYMAYRAALLRRIRKRVGWSLNTLAAWLGVGRTVIGMLESGRRQPTPQEQEAYERLEKRVQP